MMWFAYSVVWVSVSLVVAYAVNVTVRIAPLWFLFVPAFISLRSENKKKPEEETVDEKAEDGDME